MDTIIHLFEEMPKFAILLNAVSLYLAVAIYSEVRKTNGRVIRLESWKDAHDKQDDERHQEIKDLLRTGRDS